MKKNIKKNWIKLSVLLFILWIILSGRFEAKFVIIGFFAAIVTAFFCMPPLYITDRKGRSFCMLDVDFFKGTAYVLWLLVEIIKSALSVAAAVIKPKMDIQPQVIQFRCRYNNPMATAVLINSIILTPGTVTLNVTDEGIFTVHALTDDAASGLIHGIMQRKIAKVFDEEEGMEI